MAFVETINGHRFEKVFLEEDFIATHKKKKKKSQQNQSQLHLELQHIQPKTNNQKLAFTHFYKDNNLLLHGTAGTGKTFLSMYFSLSEVLQSRPMYSKLYIIRSMVPSRDMGFLPGNLKEKAKVYEAPYAAICTELFGRADAYEILKKKDIIEFIPTSFLRGTTFRDSIILIDEFQNMSDAECHTIMTRVGDNSRVIICGDTRQDDLTGKKREVSGGDLLIKLVSKMPSFKTVRFDIPDILRSDVVREWIIAREEMKI